MNPFIASHTLPVWALSCLSGAAASPLLKGFRHTIGRTLGVFAGHAPQQEFPWER
jgi:hypothetical protein